MKRILCTTILAAAAALAGCEQETIIAQGPYDPRPNAAADAASVKLPPAIAGSHAYRCKDNKLIYIDWYSDGSARVKASRNELGTQVPAPTPEATEPSPLIGSASDPTITYQGQSCKR
jgi:hypothetical protein